MAALVAATGLLGVLATGHLLKPEFLLWPLPFLAIMAARAGLPLDPPIRSDCAPLAGMIGGLATYILGAGKYLPITFGMHAIVTALVVSLALTVGVSAVTPKTPRGIIETWFGLGKA